MNSIGGQTMAGKLVTFQQELPESVDGVVDAVRKIILQGEIRSITIQMGHPIVYQRFVREGEEVNPENSTESFAELGIMDIVRNVPMEEFDSGDLDATSLVMLMIHSIELERLSATHLIVSENSSFWKWLGVDSRVARRLSVFMGARIERANDASLPDDVFLICGARHRNATPPEIVISLKGNIGEVNEEDQPEDR